MRVWILSCLLMFLASCATPVVVKPSPALTLDCGRPELVDDTYRGVTELALRLYEANEECSDRMRALRE